MNTPSKRELRVLMEKQNSPCISLYLPTYKAGTGAEMQQNPLRLRNQIREVENRLLLSKSRSMDREELLKPIQALLDDAQFWLHQSDGLAIFRSPKVFQYYRLPSKFQEQVVVGDHFYLKPLLPFLTNDGRFYVLALSQNKLRLIDCTRYSATEVELPESVPVSLSEALRYDDPDNQLNYHSSSSGSLIGKGGRRGTIFHGQGVGTDDEKDNILRYFQQVDKGLHELLHNEKAPLVLAGVDYLLPIYQKANTYAHLIDQGLQGNPDKLRTEDVHLQALPIVEPYFQKAQREVFDFYREYAGTERVSNTTGKIVLAAFYGRVENLFVAVNEEQWGIFDPVSNIVHIHKEARFNDDDLLDVAATQTLLHGGSVYAVDRAQMPDEGLLAAVFRY